MFDNQQGWKILLSHHPDSQLHLCYQIRFRTQLISLCARCLGLFPAMWAMLITYQHVTRSFWLDWCLLFLPGLPAMIDWGTTTALGKSERSNLIRLVTGAGFGISLGTNLAINTQELLSAGIRAQLVFYLAFLWLVWLISFFRRRRGSKTHQQQKQSNLADYIRNHMKEIGIEETDLPDHHKPH